MARLKVADLEINRKEPFEVEMDDGSVFAFKDPRSLHFSDIVGLDLRVPAKALGLVLGDENFKAFIEHSEVDGYFMDALLTKYLEHFGLPKPGEASA